ncbi:MAG: hypothetical protein IPH75_13380 [bacterium]|nr:hypothetical protein [bacterium]
MILDEQGSKLAAGWSDRPQWSGVKLRYRIYSNLYAPLAASQPFSVTTPEYMSAPSMAASHDGPGDLVDPSATGAAIWGMFISICRLMSMMTIRGCWFCAETELSKSV